MKVFTGFLLTVAVGLSGYAQSTSPTPTPQPLDRHTLRRAVQGARILYKRGDETDFSSAADAFKAVEASGDTEEFNLDALRLAEGLSRLRGGDPDGALDALNRIQGFPEAEQRGRHRQLKGIAHPQKGQTLAAEADWQAAIEQAQEAIDSLSQSLKETPESDTARKNLELAHQHLADYLARRPPPTPTPQPQPTPTPGPTPEASPTPTPEPSPTPEPEQQQGDEPTPTPDPQGDENPQSQQNEGEPDSQEEDSQSQEEQQGDPSDPSSGTGQESSQEELEAEEARQILDAFQEQEKAQRRELLRRQIRGIPVEKDW